MKYLVILCLSFIIIGCGDETTESTSNYILPNGLKDCKVYKMIGEGSASNIVVVRCPLSQTGTSYTVNSGKSSHTGFSIVVEGEENSNVL